MVEKPTHDQYVPSKAIREEEQEDFEKQNKSFEQKKDLEEQEDCDNYNDHENEEEQLTTVLFTLKQLEVLLKMNRPDFIELVVALKRGSSKGVGFKPAKPGNFDGVQDWKVIDAWLTKMEDCFHATKVGQHSTVELAQSYLKGYVSTWWKIVRQEEGKTHGYTWEVFKECNELEFIPKNSDYISKCKFHDFVNVTNNNLCQYVRAYFELMLEIQHMHELDCVCHFVIGFLTWVKCKLEENWPTSLSEAIMKMEGFLDVGWGEKSEFKKENKFFHKKAHHEGEWN